MATLIIESHYKLIHEKTDVYVCVVFGVGIGLEDLIARLYSRIVTGRDT